MLKFCSCLFLVLICKLYSVTCFKTIDLQGLWTVHDGDGVYKNMRAVVPGGIYTDLMSNDIIGDVFYGNNDIDTRWVANKSWTYQRSFVVNQELLTHDQVNIVFDGVDTFSEVFINDVSVGSTDNMFVRYEFDIKSTLAIGLNRVDIRFESPILKAQQLFDEQSKNYTVVPDCVPPEYHGECHANHVRKMQASFSWDWGPAFPSMGIWKNVYVEAFNDSVIRDFTVVIIDQGTNWALNVTTYLAKNKKQTLQGVIAISVQRDILGAIQNQLNVNVNSTGEFVASTVFTAPKSSFGLWMPNGYGNQPLYSINITFLNLGQTETSVVNSKIGFRTVELVQNVLGDGRTFYFKVNDVPIFAKGSNIIPVNILPEKARDEQYIRYLLESAKDVHMNMLRVWGGGMYETDTLYDVADELGIMIWQDFMFACSMYPVSDNFISSVQSEVKHQVRRLQHHPSIVLWAGNNENEAALSGNWYGTAKNYSLYKNDYVQLYVNKMKPVVTQNDISRSYLVSSPTNGIKSEEDGYVAVNPSDHFYGDVHFYNYILDSWNSNIYPITRFASEYGYQSFPSVASIMTATNNTANLNYKSQFMQSRQHHPGGYPEMISMINMRLNLTGEGSPNFDKAFIFYSQILQAMAIKIETEFYRQWRGIINDIGEGFTMGALYWQLNDVWIAPTWSGIDFTGAWKMLHYYARDFFAPIIVTTHLLPTKTVNVYVVSDSLQPVYNATLTRRTYSWGSFTPISESNAKLDILTGSTVVSSFQVNELPCGSSLTPEVDCFVRYSISGSDGSTVAPANILMPLPIKSTSIRKATVVISNVIGLSATEYSIVVTTDQIAAFVWLESGIRGTFSENGFFQVTALKTIAFHSYTSTSVQEVLRLTTVTHLLDPQYQ